MLYISDDNQEREVVWNSRDGVTPFVITLRSGKSARHVSWLLDTFVHPDLGWALPMRKFVDMTPALARDHAEAYVEKYWNHSQYPMKMVYRTKQEAIEKLVRSWSEPGAPTLVDTNYTPEGAP